MEPCLQPIVGAKTHNISHMISMILNYTGPSRPARGVYSECALHLFIIFDIIVYVTVINAARVFNILLFCYEVLWFYFARLRGTYLKTTRPARHALFTKHLLVNLILRILAWATVFQCFGIVLNCLLNVFQLHCHYLYCRLLLSEEKETEKQKIKYWAKERNHQMVQ